MTLSTSTAIVLAMPRPRAAVSYDTAPEPTREQYTAFEKMFAYFNDKLFGGELPKVMLTFSRKANATGFFIGDHWKRDGVGDAVGEIAQTPTTCRGRSAMS